MINEVIILSANEKYSPMIVNAFMWIRREACLYKSRY